ncbi:hypothetical protein BDN71DRAFT_1510352 [Pleurotus eryngii]|uniref:Uncharacterized protein n=1 Tax=Pleurotus eryngii TaxID=5323 RepID=A0A9P6DD41_PLEER|nr:hypothetical protein BDN71DRAFT_1510352 [Pleurotus eryngii]
MLKLFVFLALLCSIASASHTHSSRSLTFSSLLNQRQPQSSARKHILGRGLLKQRRPVPESWTNAKRLAAGLPLKPPVRRGNAAPSLSPVPSPSVSPRPPPPPSTSSGSHSETPSYSGSSAPSAAPSEAPVLSTRGSFGCADADTGGFVGYISKDLNAFEIDLDAAQLGPVDMMIINGGDSNYPFFGGVTGFSSTNSNLSPSSYNYANLCGTSQTNPGSPAQIWPNTFSEYSGDAATAESAIWRYDSVSGVYPQWVNLDGSKPALHLVYVPNADMFSLTGSVEAFKANFGSVTQCSLSFVPTTASVSVPTTSVY